jgi:hypothetical protein
MINEIYRILEVRKFIEYYPGQTNDEKTFMRRLKRKYNYQSSIIKDQAMLYTSFIFVPLLLISIKYKLSRAKTFMIVGTVPIVIFSSGKIASLIDFGLRYDIYVKEITNSSLGLSEVFKEILNK